MESSSPFARESLTSSAPEQATGEDSAEERRRRGRELFVALKDGAVTRGSGLSIPVGTPVRALLRPVAGRPGEARPDDVAALTAWRNRFVTAFLTEFEARPERTERWLAETVLPDDGRIVFMVDDLASRTFGYMGLGEIDWQSGYFEADSIVRGEPAPHGTMGEALQTLLRWGIAQLGLSDPWVRVRSDNPALGFYERIGFREAHRVPLRRHAEPGFVRWVEDETAGPDAPALVHMRWQDPGT